MLILPTGALTLNRMSPSSAILAMAVQNAKLHSEITELNLNLEQKVSDRTQELELANVKLKKRIG
jgi:hypothetical protein